MYIKTIVLISLLFTSTLRCEDDKFNFDISKYQSKVVYLDFWASWCIPCRESFPWMNQMHEKHSEEGLLIIAINLDEDKAMAERFLKMYPANFQIEYGSDEIAEKFQVEGMPFAIIYDKNGQVHHKHIGFKNSKIESIETILHSLLTEKSNEN